MKILVIGQTSLEYPESDNLPDFYELAYKNSDRGMTQVHFTIAKTMGDFFSIINANPHERFNGVIIRYFLPSGDDGTKVNTIKNLTTLSDPLNNVNVLLNIIHKISDLIISGISQDRLDELRRKPMLLYRGWVNHNYPLTQKIKTIPNVYVNNDYDDQTGREHNMWDSQIQSGQMGDAVAIRWINYIGRQ